MVADDTFRHKKKRLCQSVGIPIGYYTLRINIQIDFIEKRQHVVPTVCMETRQLFLFFHRRFSRIDSTRAVMITKGIIRINKD